jgi:peptidoglycan/xylan/chitin deacetylase (PgdA/CDA1 family)
MRRMFSLSAALLLSVTAIRAADGPCQLVEGGIVRGPQTQKTIALEFSADEFVEGAPTILDALASRHIKASFFLTGRCARRAENSSMIRRMIKDGHYVGPHSNSHPLLCPWTGKKRTLVTKEFFVDDLKQSLAALEKAGVPGEHIKYFLPPYEWYNEEIVAWTREVGLTLINHSGGTRSAADYTEERSRNFVSSQVIFDSILQQEKEHGLNGYLLLMQLGAGPERKDKMFRRIGALCDELQKRGYRFVTVDGMLRDCVTAQGGSAGARPVVKQSPPSDRIFLPSTASTPP